ncbi:hypothetical protein [Chryseobacterium sp. ISL-6]|uniref:hypothetical protein n=1 Tax=Chryseobacterium sp. ISL-6 TaxID=2819143 RepID=UPI001BEB6863|nr:hypothetical protein [Chryseobacterium sp. ISL-6]MBT2621241.1 hypothetical protein [Chryseobacterium sp. ISL-6]
MIVSNRNKVDLKMKAFAAILLFDTILIVSGYVLKSLINEELRWHLFFVSLTVGLFMINKLINLRVFYFENNGVTFSIRHYHPLKKSIGYSRIEYPVNRLRTFTREQLLFLDIFNIEIGSSEKSTPIKIRIKVSDLSNRDYLHIINSFHRRMRDMHSYVGL